MAILVEFLHILLQIHPKIPPILAHYYSSTIALSLNSYKSVAKKRQRANKFTHLNQ